MRRALFVFFVVVVLWTWPARAAITVISSVAAFGNVTSVTTGAINTTGANLLVAAVASASGPPTTNLTDSASNTWTALTGYGTGGTHGVTLFYVLSPTTSATQTFTSTNFASSMCVIAFASVGAYNAQASGATTASATSIQPGSLTPSVDNTVVITSYVTNNNSGSPDASINSSFTKQANAAANAGNNVGCAIAYKVQTSAGAENPTWTDSGTAALATGMAVFRPAATPGPSVPMILGFGRYLRPV